MPFAAPTNFDDPNDPNKKAQGGGVNISGQSASFATNVPGQDAAAAGGKKQGSGQYANIQSYLDANKSQADQMGQKITSEVSAQADDATQKVNSFQAQAPKVEAYDANKTISNAQNLSDDDKAKYREVKKTGGYNGPQTVDAVSGYQDAQKAASTASTNVKNAANEAGQQQLLKQTYARPQYSAGENRLDQVLLQNSAGSKANLEQLSQKYAGIDKMFADASTQVGTAVNDANTQALANRKSIIESEDAARKALIDPIKARADKANLENGAFIDRVTADASDETISEETLKALGLTEGQNLYDLSLSSYITPDKTQVGLNNAATDDERSKYAALASLFDDQSMTQITADGKAINPVSFNQDKFASDVASKKTEVENIINTKLNAVKPDGSVMSNTRHLTPQEVIAMYEQYKIDEPSMAASFQKTIDANKKVIEDAKKQYGYDRKVVKG